MREAHHADKGEVNSWKQNTYAEFNASLNSTINTVMYNTHRNVILGNFCWITLQSWDHEINPSISVHESRKLVCQLNAIHTCIMIIELWSSRQPCCLWDPKIRIHEVFIIKMLSEMHIDNLKTCLYVFTNLMEMYANEISILKI